MGERAHPMTDLVAAAVAGILSGCAGTPPRAVSTAAPTAESPAAEPDASSPATTATSSAAATPPDSGAPPAASGPPRIAASDAWCGSEGPAQPVDPRFDGITGVGALGDDAGSFGLRGNSCGYAPPIRGGQITQPQEGIAGSGLMSPPVDVRVSEVPSNLPCAAEACGLRDAARACFSSSGAPSGTVVLTVAVGADGSTRDVRASPGGAVAECLRAAVTGKGFSCGTTDGALASVGVKIAAGTAVGRPPKATAELVQAGPGIDVQYIRTIVARNQNRFSWCYRRGLLPGAGRLPVRFVIDRTGVVVAVAEGAPTGVVPPQPIRDCVDGAFRSLSFPAPVGAATVEVSYAVAFDPG